MRKLAWRPVLIVGFGLFIAGIIIVFPKWREANRRGGQSTADPFQIAGNLYFVGASDVSVFLLTGPEGHVLIDGGYPLMPAMITESVAKLGFDIKDVKAIVSTEPLHDHAAGIAELQRLTGAKLWASEANAEVLEAGGEDTTVAFFPMELLTSVGILAYHPPRVDHRVRDGDTVRVGPIALTAHLTPGHTRGCTSWSFVVSEGKRSFNVVSACSLEVEPGRKLVDPENYPGIRADFERTFRVLRSLPIDIWITSHGRPWGRYRKYSSRTPDMDPVEPFLDRAGYLAYIDSGEARVRMKIEEQRKK